MKKYIRAEEPIDEPTDAEFHDALNDIDWDRINQLEQRLLSAAQSGRNTSEDIQKMQEELLNLKVETILKLTKSGASAKEIVEFSKKMDERIESTPGLLENVDILANGGKLKPEIQQYLKQANDTIMKDENTPEIEKTNKTLFESFTDFFTGKKKITTKESSDPQVKQNTSIIERLSILLKIFAGLGTLAYAFRMYLILKHLSDGQTGCTQYLPDGKTRILDGPKLSKNIIGNVYSNSGCGKLYKKDPNFCKCLSDSEVTDKTRLTSTKPGDLLTYEQKLFCADFSNNEIIRNNPPCLIAFPDFVTDGCIARDGSGDGLGPLLPLGCTPDYKVSYSYVVKTPYGMASDLFNDIKNALDATLNPMNWIKIILYAIGGIILLIILVFLIKFLIISITKSSPQQDTRRRVAQRD